MSALMKKRLTKISVGDTSVSLPKSQEKKVKSIMKAISESTKTGDNFDLIDAIHLISKLHKPSTSSVSSKKFTSKVYGDLPKGAVHLKGARLKEGLTQQDLSDRCGISRTNISKMEKGARVIGDKVANKIAKYLKIDYRLLTQK